MNLYIIGNGFDRGRSDIFLLYETPETTIFDLDEDVSIREQLFKLFHAIGKNEFITLSSDMFSRKLLFYFYDEDVFKPNSYNRYNPEVDYEFMLQMFNKRNKDSISTLQQRKISAIIIDSIRPYLRSVLKDKIKRR